MRAEGLEFRGFGVSGLGFGLRASGKTDSEPLTESFAVLSFGASGGVFKVLLLGTFGFQDLAGHGAYHK